MLHYEITKGDKTIPQSFVELRQFKVTKINSIRLEQLYKGFHYKAGDSMSVLWIYLKTIKKASYYTRFYILVTV